MPVRKLVGGVLLLAFVSACGGSSPTQAPAGATQNPAATQAAGATQGGGGGGGGGGGATQQPAATQAGGGGGSGSKPAGWDQYGKASYEISAPISLSGELGFIPAGSVFGGDQASSLSFSYDGASAVLSLGFTQGKLSVSFGSEAGTVVGTNCTTSNLNIGSSSASGSFDCQDVLAIMVSGAQVANVTMKGTFNGHA
ncbi:MAG: hypothetical protein HYX55_06440 [Chloroflexi bacterium]|nr:hypothetical protein [Chloroflexota bacterium]